MKQTLTNQWSCDGLTQVWSIRLASGVRGKTVQQSETWSRLLQISFPVSRTLKEEHDKTMRETPFRIGMPLGTSIGQKLRVPFITIRTTDAS